MIINRVAAAALLLTLAAPAFCAGVKEGSKLEPLNYRLTFKMKNGPLSAASSFLLGSEQQAKFVDGGEEPREFESAQAPGGVGVEFKKVTTIVNCVLSRAKDGVVYGDFQFELSGPFEPTGKRKSTPMRTFQYAAPLVARLGQTVVVVEGEHRRIEIRIDEIKP